MKSSRPDQEGIPNQILFGQMFFAEHLKRKFPALPHQLTISGFPPIDHDVYADQNGSNGIQVS